MGEKTIIISISGGIAVGKTTLGLRLSNILQSCQFFQEYPECVPFLTEFYADMKKWCFHSRIAMLSTFGLHYSKINYSNDYILFDRCVDELITFAKLQYDQENLNDDEYKVYKALYEAFLFLTPRSDIVILLECSPEVALQRIAERSRAFEKNVTSPYLSMVSHYYRQWAASLPPSTKVIYYNTDRGLDIDTIMKSINEEGRR